MTSLEMAGIIISVMSLDPLRTARIDAPCMAPAWPAVGSVPASLGLLGTVGVTVPVPSDYDKATDAAVLVMSEEEASALSRAVII